MRRRLYFDYSSAENSYIIQEDGSSIFRINGNTLKFVSLEFYNGVYAGNKSTAIDFENKIADNSSDPFRYLIGPLVLEMVFILIRPMFPLRRLK